MNKFITFLLAILGGVNVLFDITTPIILILIYQKVFGLTTLGSFLLFGLGLVASIFRAIRVGWLK